MRRDAKNAKLKARIKELESEFRDRITKVEQQTLQSTLMANDNSSNNNSSNFNLVAVPKAITVPANSAKCLMANRWKRRIWIVSYLRPIRKSLVVK